MGLSRGVPAALVTALQGFFHPVLLIEADWPEGMVRLHTGTGDLSWDGKTWSGAGVDYDGRLLSLVSLDLPAEAGGLSTPDASISVAGRIEDVMAQRGAAVRNRALRVWFGATTERGGTVLVADPVAIFAGYFASRSLNLAKTMDPEKIAHDLVLGLGVGPSARAKASIIHGYEDQQARYPGDTAGRHVQNALKNAANPPTWPET